MDVSLSFVGLIFRSCCPMIFRIISNRNSNHLSELRSLLKNCSEAIIASPFITEEAVDKLFGSDCGRLKNLTVITTLKKQDYDQLRKVPVLLKLCSLLESKPISLTIKIDNSLHGKIYVGIKDSNNKEAIISSANLTGNGLEKHHEWGVLYDDPHLIKTMCEQILRDSEYEINKDDLQEMSKLITSRGLRVKPQLQSDVDLIEIIKPSQTLNGRGVTWWLKPLGTIDSPVQSSVKFDQSPFKVTFAKGVGNIKKGDVLIVYAVKSQKIIAIYMATEQRGKNSLQNQRWPYFVECNNVTTRFGAEWSSINLTLSSLIETYLKKNTTKVIHHSSRDLAVMKRGLDRLTLDSDFASFVVDEVMKREKRFLP